MAQAAEPPPLSSDAEAGPLPEPLLSFREHMWDSFGKLWNDRVEPSRKLLDDFTASVRDRIQVERTYAMGLAKLTSRLEPHIKKGIVPPPIEAHILNVRHRAEQSEWIADEMEQDVLTPIETMLSQHAEVCKRVHADGQKLTKQWQETHKSYEQLAAKYAQASSDAEESAKECLHGVSLRPAERTKVAARSIMLARQATTAEKEYYKGLQRLNGAIETQQRQIGNVLQALQAIEEKRGQCWQDTAMKVVVYESSWLRNMQYDLEGVIKANNDHDPEVALQAYIRENQSTRPLPVRSSPKRFWELSASGPGQPRGWPSGVAVQQGEAVFNERLNVVRPLLGELLTPATDGSGGTPSPPGESRPPDNELTELHRGLVEDGPEAQAPASQHAVPAPLWSACATYRAALCTALREAVLGTLSNTNAQSRSLERVAPVRLGTSAFAALVALFRKALDGCMQENDVWNGRELMVLAPKVTAESSDEKVESVLAKVFPHTIWGQKAFWEEMLLVSIAEAHALVAINRRNDAAGADHPEVALTGFLQTYVHYMHLFGIKPAQAHDSVAKTLQKHSNLLGNTGGAYLEAITKATQKEPAGGAHPSK